MSVRERPLRILVVHNRYELRGGEDTVVDADVSALRERGHDVRLFAVDNQEPTGGVGALASATSGVWSRESARALEAAATSFGADVAHVHNHAYALSASIFPALERAGTPIVMTLHNYRMTCSNAYLLRDGQVCELCVGKSAATSGIRYRCFRDSRAGSTMVAGMQLAFRRAALPRIHRFLVPSHSALSVFVRARFPAKRLHVHPNAVADPGLASPAERASTALFVGRLSPEKGVETLVAAWHEGLPGLADARLEIAGAGPLASRITASAQDRRNIAMLGSLDAAQVAERMRSAAVVVVPSEWRETFGLAVVEAFAAGTPVIASDIGALSELVDDTVGWRVPPRDPSALRDALVSALTDPAAAASKGASARERYEEAYTMTHRVESLERHYRAVIAAAAG